MWEPERVRASDGPSMATLEVVSPCAIDLGLLGSANKSSYCLNRSILRNQELERPDWNSFCVHADIDMSRHQRARCQRARSLWCLDF
jgi:hypothetical protein